MNLTPLSALSFFLITVPLLISGCTVDKLEARLQADPQCKTVMNQKTGVLMPCPGTDKAFYKLLPALNAATPQSTQIPELARNGFSTPIASPQITVAPSECKPQLHQKSGGLMPCPAL